MQRIKFTEEEINQIIDLYINQHISMKKIGE